MSERPRVPSPAPSLPRVAGFVIVDKPLGWTSHDVVARMRRLAGTRKVGHAGTLDPAASGVLVLGVEKATKLLTWVTGTSKTYEASIRLGAATVTDDAEGEVAERANASVLAAVTDEDIHREVTALTGQIQQVPSAVSAIKVNGKRSYARVRGGEDVVLAARAVTIQDFTVHGIDREDTGITVTATVSCSSGTYIRALARDMGSALGVGGHLTALRRTRVGSFTLDQAHTLEELTRSVSAGGTVDTLEINAVAAQLFPVRRLDAKEATDLSHGRRISAHPAELAAGHDLPVACFAPDGSLVALAENRGSAANRYATSVLGIAAGETFSLGQEDH
ncbi:tRNA pseudouridine(55) synthase TruB [Kocuria sp. cx-116]|uniref:tRNA pseudouridine(55) synthase TruB n=1 Tax=Kocuria sp. cx-116 TaxID=2771378 RepID=UPI0016846A32|nr:tRNA pseudouridine(55) synthase TruB [Kocuria sp. cx-116]MBD2762625.1 tRNA pseudouridine(55) synthase TruB [Kocuria sp. cx-116]